MEGLIGGALVVIFMILTIWGGYWEGLSLKLPFWHLVSQNNYLKYGIIGILLVAAGYGHFSIRRRAATNIINKLIAEVKNPELHPNYQRAFRKSRRWWRSLILPNPAGWGKKTAARLEKVLDDSNAYIQKLNDEYTNPSGEDKIAAEYGRTQYRTVNLRKLNGE
jgi:transposase